MKAVLKTIRRILRRFHRRLALVEDQADRIEAAVERIERAVVELSRTVRDAMGTQKDESERRAGIGRGLLELSSRTDNLERDVRQLKLQQGPHGTA